VRAKETNWEDRVVAEPPTSNILYISIYYEIGSLRTHKITSQYAVSRRAGRLRCSQRRTANNPNKNAWAPSPGVSALRPKADIAQRHLNVR
jgi:hypothetical protein